MPAPIAPMGYIGSAILDGNLVVRARSSGLGIKQTIQMPDVVDGSIDRTLYQLGAIEVGGNLVVPIVQEGNSMSFLNTLWQYCVDRQPNGELSKGDFEVALNYSWNSGRTFKGCRVNTMSMKMTAGEIAEATIDIMGTTASRTGGAVNPVPYSPAKVVTWADIQIIGPFDTCIVKEFNFEINNNCLRNYTFCPSQDVAGGLFASNISTGKRFVNGSLIFQGFAPTDAAYSELNSVNCNAGPEIGFEINGCGGLSFTRKFRNVVFEYQTVDLQAGANAPITSTVNWYAFGGGGGQSAIMDS